MYRLNVCFVVVWSHEFGVIFNKIFSLKKTREFSFFLHIEYTDKDEFQRVFSDLRLMLPYNETLRKLSYPETINHN